MSPLDAQHLSTKASGLETTNLEKGDLAREQAQTSYSTTIGISRKGDQEERKFHISHSQMNQQFAKGSAPSSEAKSKLSLKSQSTSRPLKVHEFGSTSLQAVADHVLSASHSLSQVLHTQAVGDAASVATSTSIQWSGREPPAVIYRKQENVSLSNQLVGNQAQPQDQEAERELRTARQASQSSQPIKEFGHEPIDILTQWKVVDRDLDAHTKLNTTIKSMVRLATLEATEQVQNIMEQWQKPESKALLIHVIRMAGQSEPVRRAFHIEPSAVANVCLTSRADTHPHKAEKLVKEKRRAVAEGRELYREFCLEWLNAVVALHCVPRHRPPTLPPTLIWADSLRILAAPMNLLSGLSIQCTAHITQPLASVPTVSKLIRTANYSAPALLTTEESLEERRKLVVDLQGPLAQILAANKVVRIANAVSGGKLAVEEFQFDECLLYIDLTTRDIKYLDIGTIKPIPRELEIPSILKTKAAGDETLTISEQWDRKEGKELANKLIIVAREGDATVKKCKEAGDEVIQLGYVYDKHPVNLIQDLSVKDSRHGGSYGLDTKASTQEDRQLTCQLIHKLESEIVRKKMPYKFRLEIQSMRLLESTQENADIHYSMQKPLAVATVKTLTKCPQTIAPGVLKCKEVRYQEEKVHYDLSGPPDGERHLKTSITVDIPLQGGIQVLNTPAAEETILDVVRELHIDAQFAFFNHLVVCANEAVPQVLTSKASTSITTSLNNTWSREDLVEKAGLTIKDKNRLPSCDHKCKESSEIAETSYLVYNKEAAKETIGSIQKEKRFGGYLRLTTDAAQQTDATYMRELVSAHIQVAHCSKLVLEANLASPLAFTTRFSSLVDRFMQAQLQRAEDRERVQRFGGPIYPPNKTWCAGEWSRTPPELLIQIANTGPGVVLHTTASSDSSQGQMFNLVRKRDPSPSGPKKCIKCARSIAPASFSTLESKSVQTTVNEQWTKEESKSSVEIVRKWANQGTPCSLKNKESSSIAQIANFQYSRNESSEDAPLHTVWQSRFGGAFVLSTYSAKDAYTSLANGNLQKVSPHPTDLSAKDRIIDEIRRAQPLILSTKASGQQILVFNCALQRVSLEEKRQHHQKSANDYPNPIKCSIQESQAHSETLNCSYKKELQASGIELTRNIPRFGGQFVFGAKKAGDAITSLEQNSLENDSPRHLQASKIIQIANQPVGGPFVYRCPSAGDALVALTQHLQPAILINEKDLQASKVLKIALDHDVLPTLVVQEPLFTHQHINCNYQKPLKNLEFTEIRHQPRDGGRFQLSTHAASSSQTTKEIILRNPLADATSLTAEISVPITQTIQPALLTGNSSGTETTNTTAQLQKTEQRMAAPQFKLTTARAFENPPSIKVTESREIEQLNNVQLHRPEQFASPESFVQKEARWGGQFSHSTIAAQTTGATPVIVDWSREESRLVSNTWTLWIPNNADLIPSFNCGGSTSEEATVNAHLQATVVTTSQAKLVLKDVNRGPVIQPWRFIESRQEEMTTNVGLQATTKKEEESDHTVNIARLGGIYSLNCQAAGKIDSGERVIELRRLSASEEAPICILKLVNQGPTVMLNGKCTEETIFKCDISLERQSTKMSHELTMMEARKEAPAWLATGQSGQETVNVATAEVNRRLREVEVEGVMAAAREHPSLTLYTESAEETIIRLDAVEQSKPWRHTQIVEESWQRCARSLEKR
uniref:Vitellogenin n=1 Tax=Ditylenchus dipsaci TaxID=166011 RepID=A0A915D172_9BILA